MQSTAQHLSDLVRVVADSKVVHSHRDRLAEGALLIPHWAITQAKSLHDASVQRYSSRSFNCTRHSTMKASNARVWYTCNTSA